MEQPHKVYLRTGAHATKHLSADGLTTLCGKAIRLMGLRKNFNWVRSDNFSTQHDCRHCADVLENKRKRCKP